MKLRNSECFSLFACLLMSVMGGNIATAQGALTNGWTHGGTIAPVGDSDAWTFSATSGDSIIIKVGRINSTNNFIPRIRLINPNSIQQALASSGSAPEIAVTATNSGTFTVIVDDYYGTTATGTYQITLVKTGSAVVISPGDEGGPMTNGYAHLGNMPVGDLDPWTFTASAGDAIVVKVGQMSDTNLFEPWVRLYGPDGVLVGSSYAATAAEVTIRATNSGTFLVVVGNNPYNSDAGSGTYLLTLVKTGSAVVISPGDEGGPMTNGYAHLGNMPVGDLDPWTFTASAGDAIVVKVGQMSDTNLFEPWVRLYGPDGVLVGSSYAATAAEVTIRATNSGTFLVVVGNNPYNSDAGSGTYLLTLAKTGSQIVVPPGSDGGSLSGVGVYNGSLPIGGVDLWTFTICAGEAIDVRADEITQTNNFDPWVRLYGPGGLLIGSSYGTTFGEVALTSTNSGTFLVVVGNNPYNSDAGSGTYTLTVNGLSDGFKTCAPVIAGANVSVGGVGGTPGTNAILFTTTNIANPALWTPLRTNPFDQFGVFQYTNGFNPAETKRFFRLSHP